jgi:hypothetical protein
MLTLRHEKRTHYQTDSPDAFIAGRSGACLYVLFERFCPWKYDSLNISTQLAPIGMH